MNDIHDIKWDIIENIVTMGRASQDSEMLSWLPIEKIRTLHHMMEEFYLFHSQALREVAKKCLS